MSLEVKAPDATATIEPQEEQHAVDDASADIDADADAEHEVDDPSDSKPKKKRRIIKTPDKKFNCPNPDCGKSYSRAEHLYRHQLNHTPKQIYRCDFPGCDRNFVRADLCARHRERHTAKGSHLQRKDAFMNSARSGEGPTTTSPPSAVAMHVPHTDASNTYKPPPTTDGYSYVSEPQQYSSQNSTMTELRPLSTSNLDPALGSYSAYSGTMNSGHQSSMSYSAPVNGQRFSYDPPFSAQPSQHGDGYQSYNGNGSNVMHTPSLSSPPSAGPMYSQQTFPSPVAAGNSFRPPSSFSTLPSLPPFGLPPGYGPPQSLRSNSIISPPSVSSFEQPPLPSSRDNSIIDFSTFDPMAGGYSMPVFGDEPLFSRSPPPNMDENFLNMLLSSNGMEMNDPSPPNQEPLPSASPPPNKVPLPKLEPDGTPSDPTVPSVSGMDTSMRESQISEKKRDRLFRLVSNFTEIEHNTGRSTKAETLAGNPKDPTHVMSLQMLISYITSYWVHIHQQMPILHRPTFNSETCPDLLLLTMICLGATCLERVHPLELSKTSAEMAFFSAYHIRWEIFRDSEFRPTAKLWTFQTMLLLELFEKMYSTRNLHERAHIHHATTLTVMRRGSSLIGRSANDSPKDEDDPTRTPPGPEGTINTAGQNTHDAYWNRWITAEATRRSAFAAFILDSTHATLFGHSAVMSPHELRLPLPCDEALWSATSSAEVQRVEASLAANGFKPTSFLDGLRRTLNGQKVRTNTFGRVILMAGLLNVSWHMNQRDLQVSSLGAASTLGSQIKWRSPLTRAFDFWRRDFDESLAKNDHWLSVCNPKTSDRAGAVARDNVFESRTCLHSLAHMAMHVDIVDCQVFAGADRALGRMVTDGDRAAVQRRMREQWAPSARARDATFYALRFLCEVLIPEEELASKRPHPHQPPTFSYSARDDYLLNRPWILFFAALIVWSYGYALDGPIRPSNYTLTTHELRIFDMQRYLIRMGGVASPDDLAEVKDRNSCLGMLLLLREKFQEPRWELLHEASETLASTIELLVPAVKGSGGA
ncbi:uncharacterized protein LTR77_007770 [Saxophila tyrrhenica]|uniref:C2H2-type domain-containing protein n=1 Tax=Saxophila tyrrhenica TaxID=1690608 RepID=A0AAV9P3H0_9PEZI|nr:hypothetical protein LTR77_007770 [Saxophila tyrrhenica]